MTRRRFYPPATCQKCGSPPALGNTLWHNGVIWICPVCLADETPGEDMITKTVHADIQSKKDRVISIRARAAGQIEDAQDYERQSKWHAGVAHSINQHAQDCLGSRLSMAGANGSAPEYFKDTLSDPDLVSVESSAMRGKLLLNNDVVALGIDISNTVGASNTMEKLLAHQIALAHKIAFQQAELATNEDEATMAFKRLQISAKMMGEAQQGMLTLQKLRNKGAQQMVVQHVHVTDGGRAVVGTVYTKGCRDEENQG